MATGILTGSVYKEEPRGHDENFPIIEDESMGYWLVTKDHLIPGFGGIKR